MLSLSACTGSTDPSGASEQLGQAQQALTGCQLGLTVGPNVNMSRLPGNQQEVAIIADPSNGDRMFAFSNMELGSGMFAAFSTDGGLTWNSSAGQGDTSPNDFMIADGNDGLVVSCCDPTLAWDEFGNLFVSYLGGAGPSVIAISTDGGATIQPLASFGAGTDQPTVAVGPGSAGSLGSLWITYSSGGIQVQGAPVNGLGAANVGAFSAAVTAPSAGVFGDIAVGPAGQVAVTGQSNTTIFTDTDPDGLGPLPFAAGATIAVNVAAFDFLAPQPDRSVDAEAGLAFDRSGGPNHGRLYIGYNDELVDESDDFDVFVRFSDDDGVTWSAPVRANDDATTRSQFLPRLALDQSTGFVGLSFHDARNDAGLGGPGDVDGVANSNAQLFAAVSVDGGLTFLPNVQVSAGTSDEDGSEPPGPCCADLDYGDFAGLTFQDGVLHPAWADNSNSTGDNPNGTLMNMDVYTAAVIVGDGNPPVFTFVPPDIVTTSCGALDIGAATAADECDPSVTITNDAPAIFPPGTTIVTWTATDDSGNSVTAIQRVTRILTDDAACCPAGTNIIQGTSNNDVLVGTNGSDCILGRGSQDTINGLGGNDFISGGDGNDSITAGAGDDVVFGGTGQDTLAGNTGNDNLNGGDGDDNLQGGDDDDTLNGDQGQDVLQGQAGNDDLNGGSGDDNLQGGDGNDDLVGGTNNDVCAGGAGVNTFAQCEFGAPNSCVDGVQNGNETDVDCGAVCGACANGDSCLVGSDCQSGLCSGGLCQGAPGTSAVTTSLDVTTDWGGGYCVELRVTNAASTATTGFNVSLDTNGATIFTSWNGTFSGGSGAISVAPCCSSNSVIAPGETETSIGFCANRSVPGSALPIVTATSATF
jgi:Ca2+-binding RTX toxin-like protein